MQGNINVQMAQPQQSPGSQSSRAPDREFSNSQTIQITDIAVDGLPKPRITYLAHKCYVELTVGDQKRTTSKVERSRDYARWQEQFTFIVAPSSALEIRIYDKRIIAGEYHFVGGIQRAVEALLSQDDEQAITYSLGALGIRPSNKIQGSITFRVVSGRSNLPSDMLHLGDQVNQASQGPDRCHQPPPILNASEQVLGFVNVAAVPIEAVDTCFTPMLDHFKVFLKVVDGLVEVHPYAKAAWSVLSFAYKAALSQKIRDEAIKNLVVTMSDMYAFLCEAEQVRRFQLQAKILTVMLKQTEECAYFIQGYVETKNFSTRAAKHLFTSVDDKIKCYQETFVHLKDAFQENAILHTEIIVTRIMDLTSHTSASIDLNDIPYAPGVRFSGTPRCLLGTREGILERIQLLLSGIEDDRNTRIVLLTGVAGYGKSAIASTIAERFEERGRLTSSFFFNRNDHNRNRVDNVFTTMARDIADRNPEIKDKLWAIIKDSRSLRATTDVREQFAQFILSPAQQVTTVGPVVAVFDGVDECGNPETREPFLDVLANEFPRLPANFRILITARPDADILRRLASLPFVKHIRIEDIDRQSTEVDLTAFVSKELSVVETELEEEWPKMRWRDELVQKADCLFIWVSTACRFVKNQGKGGTDYAERLKLILSHPANSVSLAPLDSLYMTVLQGSFDEEDPDALGRFKAVVGKILAAEVPLSIMALSDFLEADELESYKNGRSVVESVVRYLGSVLIGTTDGQYPLQVLHLSFKDFLTDSSRSGAFFIDPQQQTESMTKLCLDLMRQHLRCDMIHILDPTSSNPELPQVRGRMEKFETLQYTCRYWVDHTVALDAYDELILRRIEFFFDENALHWMETLSLTKQFDHVIGSLDQLENWLKRHQAKHSMECIMELIHDLKRTSLAFGGLISRYALQVYSSVMTFVPRETMLAKRYAPQNQCIGILLNGRSRWPSLLATLSGHPRAVHHVLFSPDGTRLASSSEDGTVRLWDPHTGNAVGDALLTGHTNWVSGMCFSPDSTRLASCSTDSTARLWNAHTGCPIGDALVGHTHQIVDISFSPDGTRLASCSGDHTVRLWDAHTSNPIGDALVGHTSWVSGICFSPDGSRLASYSSDHTVRLWDARTGSPIGDALVGHTDRIDNICFSPDGSRLASCSHDGIVRLRDGHTGSPIGEALVGRTDWVNHICFSPDSTRLASCSGNYTVKLWDAQTGSPIGDALVGHTSWVQHICFSPDGTRLASCSGDGTVRLWDAYTGSPIGDALVGHTHWVNYICFSSDGTRLASCSEDHTVRLWHAQTGRPIGDALVGHTGRVFHVCFSPDGNRLASCSQDLTVRLWDACTGNGIGDTPVSHTGMVSQIHFSPDGTRFVSCSGDRTMRLWDAHTGSPIGDALVGHTNWVDTICFSPDGSRLASYAGDNTARLWDTHTGSPIGDALQGHTNLINHICFSPDGTRLASCSKDHTVRLWDVHTGSPIALVGHTGEVFYFSFSPDGTRLASCSEDHTARLWDAHTGTPIGEPLAGHTGSVSSISFSPDGARLASHSQDRTVRLWDANSGSPIGDALSHTDMVNHSCFSPDSARFASCSFDHTIRLWDAHTGSSIGDPLVGHTEQILGIYFSPDGTRLASCSIDYTVRLWDAHTGGAIGDALVGHTDSVCRVRFSSDGNLLVTTSYQERLTWNLSSLPIVQTGASPHLRSLSDATVIGCIDNNGWLHFSGHRTLWIPEHYRGYIVEGFRRVGDAGATVCIGGSTGTISIFWFPDLP